MWGRPSRPSKAAKRRRNAAQGASPGFCFEIRPREGERQSIPNITLVIRDLFDFLAASAVFEDVWYIIPENKIVGMKSISLHNQMHPVEMGRVQGRVGLIAARVGLCDGSHRRHSRLRQGLSSDEINDDE